MSDGSPKPKRKRVRDRTKEYDAVKRARRAASGIPEPVDIERAISEQLVLLQERTRGIPTDADGDIDFAYRNMASPDVTPLMAPSTSGWSWYIYSRTWPEKFLEICAKREDAKAKMAGTITNQRMEDDRRQQFAVIERLEKELTMDVDEIITELMEKFPGDVRRVVAKFDVPTEQT